MADDLDLISVGEEDEAPLSLEMEEDLAEILGGEEGMDLTGADKHDANLAEYMEESALDALAISLLNAIEQDEQSRQQWITRLTKGIDELGFDRDDDSRDDPFPGASGVIHPLFAQSCVDFQAGAMKEMCPPQGPVRTRIFGNVTPDKEQKSIRVREHMNYQLTVDIPEYRSTTGILLMMLPISGSVFRKTFWDTTSDCVGFEYIRCDNLIVDYGAVDIDSAVRVTHQMFRTEDEVKSAMRSGLYRDIDLPKPGEIEYSDLTKSLDKVQGIDRPSDDVDPRYTLMECYCKVDLEGFEHTDENGEATGIASPYVVTIDKEHRKILSIYRGWSEDDKRRKAVRPIAHYKYRPWDGFYGVGLFHLIGGLSKAATGALRALIDSAMISNTPGGIRLKGGRTNGQSLVFSPLEWQEIDTEFLGTDPDIRKIAMAYPMNGPSPVLYQLLEFVVNAGQAFASVTAKILMDANTNSPVGTTLALIEQGAKVYSAIHADLHAVQGRELQMMARFNGLYLSDQHTVKTFGGEMVVSRKDYDADVDVVPFSDPNIFSDAQRFAQIQAVLQLRQQFPGKFLDDPIIMDALLTLRVPNPERYLMQEQPAVPLDPVSEFQALIAGKPVDAFEGQDHLAHSQYLQAIGNDPQYAAVIPMIAPRLQTLIAAHLAMQAKDEAMAQVQQYLDQAWNVDQPLDKHQLMAQVAQIMSQYQQQATAARVQQAQQAMQPQGQPMDLLGQAAMDDVKRKAAMDVQEAEAKAAEIQLKAAQDSAANDTKFAIEREKIAAEERMHEKTLIAEDLKTDKELEVKLVIAASDDKHEQSVTGPVGRADQNPMDGKI